MVNIIGGPDGAVFDQLELAVPLQTIVIWTNRTAEPQAFRLGRPSSALAPQG